MLRLTSTRFLLHIALLLFGSLAAASASFADASLEHQRQGYRQALHSLQANDIDGFEERLAELTSYPLYPYLLRAGLRQHFAENNIAQVNAFLDDYSQQLAGQLLRQEWLDHLRHDDRWEDFLAYYPANGGGNTINACYYHEALLNAGRTQEAVQGGLALWNVGRSQPNACDSLFDRLIEADAINDDIGWERFLKSLAADQTALARYATRFLTRDDRKRAASHLLSLAADSSLIGNHTLIDQIPWPARQDAIRRALGHLARTDAPAALRHWRHHDSEHIDTVTRTAILGPLVRGHHQQGHHQTGDELLLANLDLAEGSLLEWRLREAIRSQDWPATTLWISRLPKELREHERWVYWRVRAAELAGAPLSEAESLLAGLSRKRSFYGFIASQRLGRPYDMEYQPATVPEATLEQVQNNPAISRARELLVHQAYPDARREWQHAGRQFGAAEWIAAAKLATEWQRYQFAINAMIAAAHWDDIELRFPLAWHDHFEQAGERYDIDPISLIAIARQESAFGTDVVSPAGARGLMQLMPATAKETASHLGRHNHHVNDLFDPSVNIRLGSHYFHGLLTRFDNNRVLATAGYNAGPGRVRAWRQRTGGQLPVDAWIEVIPFAETRQYVQNVLSFSVIYAHRLGAERPMLSSLELETKL